MKMQWLENDFIINKLKPFDCILSLESAADMLGLSNGPLRNKITVYSVENIVDEDIECIKVDNYDNIKYLDAEGIFITTKEQTMIDILRYDRSMYTILESLSNYYFLHDESFEDFLKVMPDEVRTTFEFYKQDAIEYYNED